MVSMTHLVQQQTDTTFRAILAHLDIWHLADRECPLFATGILPFTPAKVDEAIAHPVEQRTQLRVDVRKDLRHPCLERSNIWEYSHFLMAPGIDRHIPRA